VNTNFNLQIDFFKSIFLSWVKSESLIFLSNIFYNSNFSKICLSPLFLFSNSNRQNLLWSFQLTQNLSTPSNLNKCWWHSLSFCIPLNLKHCEKKVFFLNFWIKINHIFSFLKAILFFCSLRFCLGVVMCSETSSPRLSFSHDLSELQVSPMKQDVTLLHDSNSDFEFNTSSTSLGFESSSADELFSNGVILPIQMQDKTTARKLTHHLEHPQQHPHTTKLPPRPCSSGVDKVKKDTIRELLDVTPDHEKKPHSKSFWGFNRSKSLNRDTKKNMTCSISLLSRSNSTGSVPNPKRVSSNKHASAAKSSSSSSYSYSSLNMHPMQKSPSGKGYGGYYPNGLRINPVLNVPTPCVSKGSANLFSLGSFLRVGKVKKSKKWFVLVFSS